MNLYDLDRQDSKHKTQQTWQKLYKVITIHRDQKIDLQVKPNFTKLIEMPHKNHWTHAQIHQK